MTACKYQTHMAERGDMSWCDLQLCMHDILHGLIPTRLKMIALHKPVIARLAKMLDACDVLALRAAYEGYTRLFAHGRWHPNLPTQWFHGMGRTEHNEIVRVLRASYRYDLLEMLIGVMPMKCAFTAGDFYDACERTLASVDIVARALVKHKIVRPWTDANRNTLTWAYGSNVVSLHKLTREICMLPSVRALLACLHPREIANAIAPSSWRGSRDIDPDVVELLKTIYINSTAATDYVTAHENDVRLHTRGVDELESEYMRVLLSDNHYQAKPWYGPYSFEFVDDTTDHPIFVDVPEDLKTAVSEIIVYDRNYVGT